MNFFNYPYEFFDSIVEFFYSTIAIFTTFVLKDGEELLNDYGGIL